MAQGKSVRIGPWVLVSKVSLKLIPVIIKVVLFGGSFAAYALLFTWQFALIILGTIFIHELGHIWAMKRFGLKTKGIYFIPFFGGAAVPNETFRSRREEAVIAIMGPLWGLGMSLVFAGLYFWTHNPLMAAVAGWGALIHLFNLVPVVPLDGGRVLKSVAMSIGSRLGIGVIVGGMVLSGILVVQAHIWIFAGLLIFGLFEALFEWRDRNKGEARPSLPTLTRSGIATVFLSHIGLAVALGIVVFFMSHEPGAAGALATLQG